MGQLNGSGSKPCFGQILWITLEEHSLVRTLTSTLLQEILQDKRGQLLAAVCPRVPGLSLHKLCVCCRSKCASCSGQKQKSHALGPPVPILGGPAHPLHCRSSGQKPRGARDALSCAPRQLGGMVGAGGGSSTWELICPWLVLRGS